MFCRRDVEELRERSGQGSFPAVLLVAPASREACDRFFDERWPEARVVSDEDARLFEAFGLGQGSIGQILGPKTWLPGLKHLLRHGAGAPSGDPRLLTGWFLIVDRAVRWSQVHEHIAERRRYEEMLGSLEE